MSESIPSDTDARGSDDRGSESGDRGVERTDGGVVGRADGPGQLLGDERVAPVSEEPSQERSDGDVRVCWLDDDNAETLINSLSSETARSILTALYEQHSTASELADEVDTSVQNVRHHLDNLQDAGLAEVAGTRYSVKGREMDVYAPSDDQLVVAVGREDDRSSFLDSLRSLLGAVGALVVGSVLVQWSFGATNTAAGAPRIPDSTGGTIAPATSSVVGLPPGLAFFAGGVLVLATVLAVTYLRE
jgi:DNA-binding transcriptional ArsR family regulator